MSNTKHKHVWSYPNCPECGSDIFVSGAKGQSNTYECHTCDLKFEKQIQDQDTTAEDIQKAIEDRSERIEKAKETRDKQYNWRSKHVKLLGKLQELEFTYFKASTLGNKHDYSREELAGLFAALHERDLIAVWGSLGNKTTWYLTDKGKNITPEEYDG